VESQKIRFAGISNIGEKPVVFVRSRYGLEAMLIGCSVDGGALEALRKHAQVGRVYVKVKVICKGFIKRSLQIRMSYATKQVIHHTQPKYTITYTPDLYATHVLPDYNASQSLCTP
jgi:hypothetical protein